MRRAGKNLVRELIEGNDTWTRTRPIVRRMTEAELAEARGIESMSKRRWGTLRAIATEERRRRKEVKRTGRLQCESSL